MKPKKKETFEFIHELEDYGKWNFKQGIQAERKRVCEIIEKQVKVWHRGCSWEMEQAVKQYTKELRDLINEEKP
jgi:hypothetical protein